LHSAHRSDAQSVTDLLIAWREGDAAALTQLMPMIYTELKKLAHRCMRGERAGRTLETTGLVNEAYLRLINASRVQWRDRAHFFAFSAQLMRRILVDEARKRALKKRGAGATRVTLDEYVAVPERTVDLLALDQALERLAAVAPRKVEVVELRFFAGLTIEETAAVLGVSPDIVKREWRTAKLWLLRELDTNADGRRALESD
jgi:RNA polymerase sigma-70 factor, ECF subfamily